MSQIHTFCLWFSDVLSILMCFYTLYLQVVIGQKFIVPSYSKVSRLQQPTKLDSDDELEYADNSSGIAEMSCNAMKFCS